MTKRISPGAIHALKEALTAAYWYRSDLRSFLLHSLSDPALVARLDWQDYKRNIVGSLVDHLARHEDRYQDALLRLMLDVAGLKDFSHLLRVEDGSDKAKRAAEAVSALNLFVSAYKDEQERHDATEQARAAAYEASLKNQAVRQKLSDLQTQFFTVIGPAAPQERGYKLESILRDLFELFDLDPRASFRIQAEQIDGAFTFDNTDYLLEAKWQQEPLGLHDLDAFRGKIDRKLENTLGLLVSINGFASSAVEAHSSARPVMILMEGSHLMAILEGRIDLLQLLLRMRRHASQTGEILLPLHKIFAE
jgi:hypothetical protein